MNQFQTSIWKFEPKSVVKQRAIFYSEDVRLHPAKMPTYLARQIISTYTNEGDWILDPMAGVGTTLIEAYHLNRNSIGVEFEQKFIDIINQNIKLNIQQTRLGEIKPFIKIIKGDSRELSKLLQKEVNSIIFSPPFGKSIKGGGINNQREQDLKIGCIQAAHLSEDDNNISNLSYGIVDAIVVSPPYASMTLQGLGGTDHIKNSRRYEGREFSYKDRVRCLEYDRLNAERGSTYSRDEDNISNFPYGKIDAIISSPPYSNRLSDSLSSRQPSIEKFGTVAQLSYSNDPNNIGRMTKQTYLEAMYKVYLECYKVLKKDGYMVLVVKNFRRNQEEVNLMGDTITLCKKAGFQFWQTIVHALNHASFWQLNIHKKTEKLLLNLTEYVLVFRK